MAEAAGITMNEWSIAPKKGVVSHFLTKRFDRLDYGTKLHMPITRALLHYDSIRPAPNSYEQPSRPIRRLGLAG